MLPTFSARWSLNYSQAGALINVQYVASTLAVAVSGMLAARWGFRFAIKTGLLLMSAGVGLLLVGPKGMGIFCIGAYGGGLGLAVPAANLMVAEVNPGRRSATLNLLNFCWSMGAVACPFLVGAAAQSNRVPLLLGVVAGFALLMAIGIAAMPASIVEPAAAPVVGWKAALAIPWKNATLWILAALFFLYVGVENGFGFWLATYSKSLGKMSPTMAIMTSSFFYAAMMLGRWLALLLLRLTNEIRLVQVGLLAACTGMAGLVFSSGLSGVVASACLAGLGLSYVYPITISLLSREFGSDVFAAGIHSVHAVEYWRRTPSVDGGSFVESFRQSESWAGSAFDRMRGDVSSICKRVEGDCCRGLGSDEPCREAREADQSVEWEQRFGETHCLPFAWAWGEDEALQESAAIGGTFPQTHHETKIGRGLNVVCGLARNVDLNFVGQRDCRRRDRGIFGQTRLHCGWDRSA